MPGTFISSFNGYKYDGNRLPSLSSPAFRPTNKFDVKHPRQQLVQQEIQHMPQHIPHQLLQTQHHRHPKQQQSSTASTAAANTNNEVNALTAQLEATLSKYETLTDRHSRAIKAAASTQEAVATCAAHLFQLRTLLDAATGRLKLNTQTNRLTTRKAAEGGRRLFILVTTRQKQPKQTTASSSSHKTPPKTTPQALCTSLHPSHNGAKTTQTNHCIVCLRHSLLYAVQPPRNSLTPWSPPKTTTTTQAP
ncbi:hypothetical protein LZ30DRAFT_807250 [Colletotrichum cereale]|nr:hypothetical protein LZ30DRAFT_807250 [Colletotrichum cereale]